MAFNRTNGHRPKTRIQCTRAFTKTVLRTDSSTDLRQAVGLVRQFRRFNNSPFTGQFEPVGDIVVNRTFPLTIGVTASDATFRLCFTILLLERVIDLCELPTTRLDGMLVRFRAVKIDEFKLGSNIELTHPTTLKGTALAGTLALSCFGSTTRNLSMKCSKLSSTRCPHSLPV